jgi:hypothetical protein
MSQPRYIDAQRAWLLSPPAALDCEVLVAGDCNGPDSRRLAEAKKVLGSLTAFRDRAAAYLDEFVDRERIEPGSQWFLEGIGFGLDGHVEGEFELSFSLEGDTYGSWSVTFRASSGEHWPVAFNRRQI